MTERQQRIVLDFDNFLTDGEQEKYVYQSVYLPLFCQRFGIPPEWVAEEFPNMEKQVVLAPADYLYTVQGFPVGPGTSDHMLLTFSTAAALLTLWKQQELHTLEPITSNELRTFSTVYAESYPKTGTIFRYDARDLILDLFKTKRLSIISGSDTSIVQQKMNTLLHNSGIAVEDVDIHGNARKTTVDRSIPHAFYAPWILHGFPYPLYFHRPQFEYVIHQLPQTVGVAASDQYTGDLSQYEHIGAFTILLETPFTAFWEVDWYNNHHNGIRVKTLTEVREALDPFV